MRSDPTPCPASLVADRPDRVLVVGLHLDCYVGVHDFERRERQCVRFDVEIDTIDSYAEMVRTTGAYVSYADIVEYIERRATEGDHVELVETWAEDIASFVLGNELAAAVRVTVQKTDVFDAADGVGVAIERRREPASGTGNAP